jgi:hypothetical protein
LQKKTVLAFPYYFQNLKKGGGWKIDYKKLLLFGIPALYLTFYLSLYFFTPLSRISVPWFVASGIDLYKIGGMILGYVIVSSFYKAEINQ